MTTPETPDTIPFPHRELPPTLEDLTDTALRELYGDNLDAFYEAEDRHMERVNAILAGHQTSIQLAFQRAFTRAVAEGCMTDDPAGFEVHARIEDFRGGQEKEMRAELEAENARFWEETQTLRAGK